MTWNDVLDIAAALAAIAIFIVAIMLVGWMLDQAGIDSVD